MRVLESELLEALEDIRDSLGVYDLEIRNIEFYDKRIDIICKSGGFEVEHSLIRDESGSLKIMTFEL